MLLFIAVACEQSLENEEINIPKTDLQGNWTVNAYVNNDIVFGPFTISTHTTPKDESVYIKDNGEFWNFQIKANVLNSSDLFEAKSTVNEISSIEAKIMILDGSVVDTDNISFDIQFEDDETPYGITYNIKGHRK